MMHTLIDLQVRKLLFDVEFVNGAEYLQASKCKISVIDLITHQIEFEFRIGG